MSDYDDVVTLCSSMPSAVDVKDVGGNESRGPLDTLRSQPDDSAGVGFLSSAIILTIPYDHLPDAVEGSNVVLVDVDGVSKTYRVRERTPEDGDTLLHNLWLSL
jgi:hypothetical protein